MRDDHDPAADDLPASTEERVRSEVAGHDDVDRDEDTGGEEPGLGRTPMPPD